ncbi:hypothetical protein BDQ17DRAFT_1353043 [Cyathus striatus]|nr:hypothetical protein BDQ17DRAFT_1353043 [Cyathus striatus]
MEGMILSESTPLDSRTFFSSPIETLLESLEDPQDEHVTLHDVIEAYAMLSTRIRVLAKTLLEVPVTPQPALETLQAHSRDLHKCLSRDIQRATAIPLHQFQSDWTVVHTLSEIDLPPECLQDSKDIANVCHHALQVIASVFLFRLFIHYFPVCLHTKTRNLVFWIIQTQQLPFEILFNKIEDIKGILQMSMDNGDRLSQASADSLRSICQLLRRHPQKFIDIFACFLEPTLAFLSSGSFELRLDAADALCSFAAAKIQLPVTPVFETFAESIRMYIEGQVSKVLAHKPNCLPTILSNTISDDKGKGPRWIVAVVASIILSDYLLFLHPKSLKLVLNALSRLRQNKRDAARTEHSLLWKCLIWAFSRIPRNSSDAKLEDIRRKAFNVVRQELTRGLLSTCTPSDVDPARTASDISLLLGIPSTMITNHDHLATFEGLALLNQIMRGSKQTDKLADNRRLFPLALIDGSLLKPRRPTDDMTDTVKSLGCTHLPDIRPLTQNEIVYHLDDIINIWKCSTQKALMESELAIPEDVFTIWRALLSLYSYLGQQTTEPAASFKFSVRVASIIAGFAIHGESAKIEIASLSFMRNLWLEMCNATSHHTSHIAQLDATRELWAIFGRNSLLKSVLSWTLTDFEIDIWRGIFTKFIDSADMNKNNFIEMLAERLSEEKLDCFSKMSEVVIIILSEITTEQPGSFLTRFFNTIGQTMQALYGTEQELDGLCIWLKDERHVLTDDDYNTVIQTIYCNPLAILSTMDLRIPPPGLGPMAFENYWKTKCQGNEEITRDCPQEIHVLLKAWTDCCSRSQKIRSLLKLVMSVATDSQNSVTNQRPEDLPIQHGISYNGNVTYTSQAAGCLMLRCGAWASSIYRDVHASTSNITSRVDWFMDSTYVAQDHEEKKSSGPIVDSRFSSPSSDDYKQWEVAVSAKDIENIDLQLDSKSLNVQK